MNPIDAWFAAAPKDQQPVLKDTRRLIKEIGPGAQEELKWGRPCYSGSTGLLCYLQSSKSHASLGFQHGASLDDPEGVLEGTGKEMRHTKLTGKKPAQREAIVALLRQTLRDVG